MTKKRICFVLNSHWSAGMGGAEYQVSLIIRQLLRDGRFEIHYLCRNAKDDYDEIGYQLHSLGTVGKLSKYAYFFDSFSLYGALKQIDPDIIYHRNGGAYTGVCTFYANRFNKNLIWNLAHEKDVTPNTIRFLSNPFKYIDKLLLTYGVHKSKCIIAQTSDQKDLLEKNYHRQPAKIIRNFHPVPNLNGCNTSKTLNVLWIANFKAAKQPELYLKIAKQFQDNDTVKFFMAGKGSSDYQPLISEISNQSNMDYLGELSQDEVNNQLCKTDIFINTSMSEGFPNTFIQAWMRSVPVISLEVDPDLTITRNRLGCYSRSLAQLYKDLESLIQNKQLRTSLGKKAREYAIKHHSEQNIEELISLF